MSERAVIEWRCENGDIVGRVTEAGVIDERHKAEAMMLHQAQFYWRLAQFKHPMVASYEPVLYDVDSAEMPGALEPKFGL